MNRTRRNKRGCFTSFEQRQNTRRNPWSATSKVPRLCTLTQVVSEDWIADSISLTRELNSFSSLFIAQSALNDNLHLVLYLHFISVFSDEATSDNLESAIAASASYMVDSKFINVDLGLRVLIMRPRQYRHRVCTVWASLLKHIGLGWDTAPCSKSFENVLKYRMTMTYRMITCSLFVFSSGQALWRKSGCLVSYTFIGLSWFTVTSYAKFIFETFTILSISQQLLVYRCSRSSSELERTCHPACQ